MDKKMRRPDHPDYDPTSLFIPKELWKKFSPVTTQYWTFKVDHFDKILCFKYGMFY
jgi:DNA mismatch repair protein MSH6